MGFGVWGLGFEVWGLGFGVWGLGFGVWGLVFGVWGLGFGVCLDLALIKLFEDFAVGLSVGPLPSEKDFFKNQDLCLKMAQAKAKIWPWLSCLCRILALALR